MNEEPRDINASADPLRQTSAPGATPLSGAEITTPLRVWSHLTLVFLVVALLLGLHIVLSIPVILILRAVNPDFLHHEAALFVVDLVPFYLLAVPLCAFLFTRLTKTRPQKATMRPSTYFVFLLIGLSFLVAGSLIGNAITNIIALFTGHQPSSANDVLGEGHVLWALLFVGILAPIFEEIIFRKYLIGALWRYGEGAAVMLSAVVFGLAHGNFSQCFYTFGLGLILGLLYCRTGKLIYSIIPHMLLNTCSTLLAYFVLPKVTELSDFSGNTEEMVKALLSALPAFLGMGLYLVMFYGGAVAGLVLLILKYRKLRLVRSGLVLEAGAGGFYHPLDGRVVGRALVKSPGFWLVIALSLYMFVSSII